jgi:dihydrofolate reductase
MATRQILFDLVIGKTVKGGIGKNNALPWKLPSDLKMFKKITTSGASRNSVIMGRKTFESIKSKPLPNRLNIVVSKASKVEENENVRQARSLDDALALSAAELPAGKAFVIGGARLFEEALGSCRYVY